MNFLAIITFWLSTMFGIQVAPTDVVTGDKMPMGNTDTTASPVTLPGTPPSAGKNKIYNGF